MKKNIKKAQTTGLLFKIFTLFIFIASVALIHLEYKKHKMFLNDAAHVMKVQIERGYNSVFEDQHPSGKVENAEEEVVKPQGTEDDRIKQEIKEDNEISSDVSNGFDLKIHEYNNIDSYRVYLASVLNLVEKFLKSEDYEHELKILIEKEENYPKEVKEILHE